MARTPGVLNPLAFDSEEDFKKALDEQGKEQGWIQAVFQHADEVVTQGELAIKKLLGLKTE